MKRTPGVGASLGIGRRADSGRYEEAHVLARRIPVDLALESGLRLQAEVDALRAPLMRRRATCAICGGSRRQEAKMVLAWSIHSSPSTCTLGRISPWRGFTPPQIALAARESSFGITSASTRRSSVVPIGG